MIFGAAAWALKASARPVQKSAAVRVSVELEVMDMIFLGQEGKLKRRAGVSGSNDRFGGAEETNRIQQS